MKPVIIAAVIGLAATGFATAQTTTTTAPATAAPAADTTAAPTAGTTAAPSAAATAMPMGDMTAQKFVDEAASGGMFEVESSKLALERSSSDDVKKFAQMMIDDHTKANEALMELAKSKNLTVPAEPAGGAAAHMMAVQDAEGDAFDKAYLEHQAAAHAEAIALFTAESTSDNDADLAAFAKKTLPTLQEHADHLKAM